jgi:uroporphyrin-III C-methyltransferase
MKPPGRVVLVGAGPGDPELLTLKAVRMLRAADVVLHDDLVSPEVLALANPAARIVAVGKRGGCVSTPQAFIDQLMIREARAGALVVRLKGGDPLVFGRGGEEMEALGAAGIAVEAVNGITAGLAAPAAIGVPLTHRTLAHGVVFVTGHAAVDGDGPDWDLLARCGLTLVIYMGVATCPDIADKLMADGVAPDMPVAVLERGTLEGSRALRTLLADLGPMVAREKVRSPAIIVVGEVVMLADAEDKLAAWAQAAEALA